MTLGVFGGAGLAARRLAFGRDTLLTVAHDHVAIRTPKQPGWTTGNALHLLRPPDDVGAWLQRCNTTIGSLPGIETLTIAWEIEASASPELPGLPKSALVRFVPVFRHEAGVRRSGAAASDDPIEVRVARDDERVWAGARALMLHADRGKDTDFWRWHQAQERALVAAGRGDVLVGYRQQVPVARVALWHDHAGLGLMTDLVVHPLHRGGGAAAALVGVGLDAQADGHGTDDVLCVGETLDEARMPPGWHRVATVVEVSDRAHSAPQDGPNVPG